MNKQEAIKMLNEMLKHCEDELEFGLGDEIDDYTRKGIKVYELAISALEKQLTDRRWYEDRVIRLAEYEETGLIPKEIKVLKEFRDKNKGVEEYFETCVAKDKAIADRDYWKAEALKHCAKLGEIKLLVGRSNE